MIRRLTFVHFSDCPAINLPTGACTCDLRSSPDSSARIERRQNEPKVARFKSSSGDSRLHRKWEVRLAEDHLCETGVYLRRWRVETPWFSVRLHHWLHSDDNRNPHDHPWNFLTLILKGSYTDESPSGARRPRELKDRIKDAITVLNATLERDEG